MLIIGDKINEISKILPIDTIVSLVPSLTETIASFGAEKKLVGVTRFCKYPAGIREKTTVVGGPKDFDVEKIISLHPDVVVAVKEENDKTGILKLADKLPVVLFDIVHIRDTFEMMQTLGTLFGKEAKAGQMIDEIKDELATIPDISSKRKTLYLIWKNPWMAAGGETFINEMLNIAGFENIVSGRYPEVGEKEFAQAEVVLLSSEPYPFNEKHQREIQQQFPEKQIILVDGEMFSWYGSRMLEAADYFRRFLKEDH